MSENKIKTESKWPNVSPLLIARLDEFTASAIPVYRTGMKASDSHAALAYHAGMKYTVEKLRVIQAKQAQKTNQTNIRTSMEG